MKAILAITCGLAMLSGVPAFASDAPDLSSLVKNLVTDINKGNFKALAATCAPHASIVDGFPPYAWQTCADWLKAYDVNNQAIHATLGTLSYGKLLYREVRANSAYAIYPVTFIDTQNGKKFIYKGTMTVTLEKTQSGWVFTGIASAWTS